MILLKKTKAKYLEHYSSCNVWTGVSCRWCHCCCSIWCVIVNLPLFTIVFVLFLSVFALRAIGMEKIRHFFPRNIFDDDKSSIYDGSLVTIRLKFRMVSLSNRFCFCCCEFARKRIDTTYVFMQNGCKINWNQHVKFLYQNLYASVGCMTRFGATH